MYILDIIVDAKQAQLRLDTLKSTFPALDLVAQSQHFATLGCSVSQPLPPEQTTYLSELLLRKMIHSYQCEQLIGPLRNEGINYPTPHRF